LNQYKNVLFTACVRNEKSNTSAVLHIDIAGHIYICMSYSTVFHYLNG